MCHLLDQALHRILSPNPNLNSLIEPLFSLFYQGENLASENQGLESLNNLCKFTQFHTPRRFMNF